MDRTLLHVEDDPLLANVVRQAFLAFGFAGEFFSMGTVADALDFIGRRKFEGGGLDLILLDMQLPDGTGLDVLRRVKANPAWASTPVIFLSGERSPEIISEAYALGANCFLSKFRNDGSIFDAVKSLYACWFESALLPPHTPTDAVRERLARAVSLRSRHGDLYNRLARAFSGTPEIMGFWLDRALSESNLANLFAFLLSQGGRACADEGSLRHMTTLQDDVERRLRAVEHRLDACPTPTADEAYAWILDITDAYDEEAFAAAMALLFPIEPVAARALKARFAVQFDEICRFIASHAGDPAVRTRTPGCLRAAEGLKALVETEPAPPQAGATGTERTHPSGSRGPSRRSPGGTE